jgi:uncharacterized protein
MFVILTLAERLGGRRPGERGGRGERSSRAMLRRIVTRRRGMNRRALLVVAGLIAVGFVLLSTLTGFLVDWLWFDTLGFGAVFATVWHTKLAVFGIATAATALALAVNGLLAVGAPILQPRRLRVTRVRRDDDTILPEVVEFSPEDLPWRRLVLVGAAGIGGLVGFRPMGS